MDERNDTNIRAVSGYIAKPAINRVVSNSYMYTYISLCCLISLAGLATNIFLFYVIMKVRSLHKPTNFLLLSLTSADLLVCSLMIPVHVERFYNQSFISNESLCLVRKSLYMLTSSASLWSLAVVSLDRMIAVTFPFLYGRYIQTRRVIYFVLAEWILCLALSSVNLYPWSDWKSILPCCSAGMPKVPYFIVTIPGLHLPGAIIFISYLKIFLVSRKQHHKISAQSTSTPYRYPTSPSTYSLSSVNTETENVSALPSPILTPRRRAWTDSNLDHTTRDPIETRRERAVTFVDERTAEGLKPRSNTLCSLRNVAVDGARKIRKKTQNVTHQMMIDLTAAKTVSIMVGVCILCWLPTAVYYAYINARAVNTDNTRLEYVNDVFLLLSFLNSLINPILYANRTRDIKRHSKMILKKCCVRDKFT